MVGRRISILAAACILGCLAAGGLAAQTIPEVNIRSMATATRDGDWNILGTAYTMAVLSLDTKTKTMQGQFALSALIAGTTTLDVTKAVIRARFPDFRILVGKSRLSWGYGFFFNAGDLLFGDTSLSADFTANELRTSTGWLASVYIPFGSFTFAEAAVRLPVMTSLALPPIDESAAGLRIQGKLAGIQAELAYLYDGKEQAVWGYAEPVRRHEAALSLQTAILVNVHASASTWVKTTGDITIEDIRDNTTASFGLFDTFSVAADTQLSWKAEGIITARGSLDPETHEAGQPYFIQTYGEVSASLPGNTAGMLRAVWSPVDMSALITGGVTWSPFESFRMMGFISVQAGEDTDTFGFDRTGGLAILCGVDYTY